HEIGPRLERRSPDIGQPLYLSFPPCSGLNGHNPRITASQRIEPVSPGTSNPERESPGLNSDFVELEARLPNVVDVPPCQEEIETDGADDRQPTLSTTSQHPVGSLCDIPATPAVDASIPSIHNPEALHSVVPQKRSEDLKTTLFDASSRHLPLRTAKPFQFGDNPDTIQPTPRDPTLSAPRPGHVFSKHCLRQGQDDLYFDKGTAEPLVWFLAILRIARVFAGLPNGFSGGDYRSGRWNYGDGSGSSRGTGFAPGHNGQSSGNFNFNSSHSNPTETSDPLNTWWKQPIPRTIPSDAIVYYQGGLVDANGVLEQPAHLLLRYNTDIYPPPDPPPSLPNDIPPLTTTSTGNSTLGSSNIHDAGLLFPRHAAPLLGNHTLFPSPRPQSSSVPQLHPALQIADPNWQRAAEPVSPPDGHHQLSPAQASASCVSPLTTLVSSPCPRRRDVGKARNSDRYSCRCMNRELFDKLPPSKAERHWKESCKQNPDRQPAFMCPRCGTKITHERNRTRHDAKCAARSMYPNSYYPY
ncbi:hypothetical protein FRB99_008765, partial [Tulasnella sp. 403]